MNLKKGDRVLIKPIGMIAIVNCIESIDGKQRVRCKTRDGINHLVNMEDIAEEKDYGDTIAFGLTNTP